VTTTGVSSLKQLG